MRNAAMLLATASLITLAACSNGAAIPSRLGAPAPEQFSLSVLPETYAFGGSARAISLQQSERGDSIELQLRAEGASGLKALYFSLDYDPLRYSPAGLELNPEFLAPTQRLELTLSGRPGSLEHGSMLLHPQLPTAGAGFSGDCVLARLRFERRADAAARRVSTPPTSAAAQTPLFSSGLAGNLKWYLYNPGDYDQNGVVAVQDLTPIGINFGASVPPGSGPDGRDYTSALDVIDGSDDGVINVQDLTAIGVNYGRRVAGFNIYSGIDASHYPADNSAPSSINPDDSVDTGFSSTDTSQFRRAYDYTIPGAPPGPIFWLRPFDSAGTEGTPSQIYDAGNPNQPPQISGFAVQPSQSMPERLTQLIAMASDPDGDPLLFSWSIISGGGYLLRDDPGYSVYNGYFCPSSNETATIRLTADDGRGGTAIHDGQIAVNNSFEGNFPFSPTQVQGWTDGSGLHSALTVGIDGLPRIYYYNESGEGSGVFLALAGSPFGNEWALAGQVGNGGFRGLAAWTYFQQSGFATYDQPGGAGNLVWYFQDAPFSLNHNLTVLDSTPATGLFPSITFLENPGGDGLPALSYHNDLGFGTGSLRFIGAQDPLGDNWGAPLPVAGEPETAGVDLGGESSISNVNGNPAIAYHDTGNQRLLYVRASDPQGSNWNAPLPAVVVDEAGVAELGASPALVTLADGRPAVFYKRKADDFAVTQLMFKVALDANGTGWYPASTQIALSLNPNSRISARKSFNGNPAVAYCGPPPAAGNCYYSEITGVDGSGLASYADLVACSLTGSSFINPSLAFVGGRAAVSVHDQTNQDLYFNIRF
ncbi:hypothetical protein IT575_03590 [bacterium]|nr:hypothetical protein [bacterium]